jgi:multiple sugar transport system permease protein
VVSRRLTWPRRLALWIANILAITFLIAPLAPLILSSVQSEKTLQGDTRALLPREYTTANFRLILSAGAQRGPIFEQVSYLPKSVERFPTAFLNSLIVGVAVTLIALALARLSA